VDLPQGLAEAVEFDDLHSLGSFPCLENQRGNQEENDGERRDEFFKQWFALPFRNSEVWNAIS
jgi:hypothetical protein